MSNRHARPTPATLGRYRSERDALLRAARANYDNHGDARRTLNLLDQARGRQRKALGLTATAGLGTVGGRP